MKFEPPFILTLMHHMDGMDRTKQQDKLFNAILCDDIAMTKDTIRETDLPLELFLDNFGICLTILTALKGDKRILDYLSDFVYPNINLFNSKTTIKTIFGNPYKKYNNEKTLEDQIIDGITLSGFIMIYGDLEDIQNLYEIKWFDPFKEPANSNYFHNSSDFGIAFNKENVFHYLVKQQLLNNEYPYALPENTLHMLISLCSDVNLIKHKRKFDKNTEIYKRYEFILNKFIDSIYNNKKGKQLWEDIMLNPMDIKFKFYANTIYEFIENKVNKENATWNVDNLKRMLYLNKIEELCFGLKKIKNDDILIILPYIIEEYNKNKNNNIFKKPEWNKCWQTIFKLLDKNNNNFMKYIQSDIINYLSYDRVPKNGNKQYMETKTDLWFKTFNQLIDKDKKEIIKRKM